MRVFGNFILKPPLYFPWTPRRLVTCPNYVLYALGVIALGGGALLFVLFDDRGEGGPSTNADDAAAALLPAFLALNAGVVNGVVSLH